MGSFTHAENQFFKLTDLLSSSHTKKRWLSEIESIVNNEGKELLRRLLQGHVDERGLGDMGYSIVGSDGIERTHKRISERQIKTLFGTIKIEHRWLRWFDKNGWIPTSQESLDTETQRTEAEAQRADTEAQRADVAEQRAQVALEEGEKNKAIETARAMLADGLDAAVVMKYTGLSPDDLATL